MRERQDPIDTELERLLVSFDSCYVWKYGGGAKQGLRELYEKAKREQWNGCEELAWDTPVDPEREILPLTLNPLADYGPFRRLSRKEQYHYQHGLLAWQLSQFLHGEQGALLTASQLVSAVPWIDAKHFAASQTMDEARHVAFGVLSLDGFYRDMPENELRDREDFIIDACRLMRDRLVGEDVADVMGFDREEVRRVSLEAPFLVAFRRSLFSRIVPNIKRLGLLSPRVRRAFEELAILEFEHHDPDAADRALGL